MATKTISIDIEAYERLRRVRRGKESFSETIKRVVHKPLDLDRWLEALRRNPLGDEAVEAIERQIAGRRRRSR